jgi:hypothetical protein
MHQSSGNNTVVAAALSALDVDREGCRAFGAAQYTAVLHSRSDTPGNQGDVNVTSGGGSEAAPRGD